MSPDTDHLSENSSPSDPQWKPPEALPQQTQSISLLVKQSNTSDMFNRLCFYHNKGGWGRREEM